MSLVHWIELPKFGDSRGSLIAIEGKRNIPFAIKRVYYIYDTQSGVARGFHAHQNLQQVLVCVSGSCRVVLDNGEVRESVDLDSAHLGLLINDMTWREMYDFSGDCVLLVLASAYYDEADYIRSYEEFLAKVEKG